LRHAVHVDPDGAVQTLRLPQAAKLVRDHAVIVCHAPSVLSRLKVDPPVPTLDILELFAFARPARFCLPTSRGLADALSLSIPQTLEAEAAMLLKAVQCLLDDLSDTVLALPNIQAMRLKGLAAVMAQSGWLWGAMVVKALGGDGDASRRDLGFQTWEFLPDWSEHAPEPSPGSIPVSAQEARAQLDILLGPNAEQRPAQADYASAVSEAFQPRQVEDEPRLVLAEAGTGTGKTLGYIAPASVWAKRNGAPVWISCSANWMASWIGCIPTRAIKPAPWSYARGARIICASLIWKSASISAAPQIIRLWGSWPVGSRPPETAIWWEAISLLGSPI
jgi:ATP-dependent DNA helicase DinG